MECPLPIRISLHILMDLITMKISKKNPTIIPWLEINNELGRELCEWKPHQGGQGKISLDSEDDSPLAAHSLNTQLPKFKVRFIERYDGSGDSDGHVQNYKIFTWLQTAAWPLFLHDISYDSTKNCKGVVHQSAMRIYNVIQRTGSCLLQLVRIQQKSERKIRPTSYLLHKGSAKASESISIALTQNDLRWEHVVTTS